MLLRSAVTQLIFVLWVSPLLIANLSASHEPFYEGEAIILEKYRIGWACAVTGEISNNNKVYEGDIVLSPEGVKRLYSQLHAEMYNKGLITIS